MADDNSYIFRFQTKNLTLEISKTTVEKIPYLSELVSHSTADDDNQYELSQQLSYDYFKYILKYIESDSNNLSYLIRLLPKANNIIELFKLYIHLSLPSPGFRFSLSDLSLILDEEKRGAEFLFNLSIGGYNLRLEKDALNDCVEYILTHWQIYNSHWRYHLIVIIEEKYQSTVSDKIKNLMRCWKDEDEEDAKKPRSHKHSESEAMSPMAMPSPSTSQNPSFIRPSHTNFYTHHYHCCFNEYDEPEYDDHYDEECDRAWERNEYGNGPNMYWDAESDEWCELP